MTRTPAPAVLCIGETMAMVAPTVNTPLVDATSFRMEAGGAESNVAARLVALGHRAIWRSRLGDDPLGARVAQALESAGVETSIEWDAEHPTGIYVKDPGAGVFYYRAGSAASHAGPELLDGVDWSEIAIVHISGITPALSDDCYALVEAVFERAQRAGVPVSFDVNHRSALWGPAEGADLLARFARRADIVFVGRDEAEDLWGTTDAASVRALLPEPGVLVVKDGPVGATTFADDVSVFEPAIPVDVVEAVGAGDAFAAGYLAGTLEDAPVAERLRRGHVAAAAALSTTADM